MTTLGTPRHFPSYADQPHAGSPLRLSKGGRSVGCALNNGSKEQAANLPGSASYSAGGMRAIVALLTPRTRARWRVLSASARLG